MARQETGIIQVTQQGDKHFRQRAAGHIQGNQNITTRLASFSVLQHGPAVKVTHHERTAIAASHPQSTETRYEGHARNRIICTLSAITTKYTRGLNFEEVADGGTVGQATKNIPATSKTKRVHFISYRAAASRRVDKSFPPFSSTLPCPSPYPCVRGAAKVLPGRPRTWPSTPCNFQWYITLKLCSSSTVKPQSLLTTNARLR